MENSIINLNNQEIKNWLNDNKVCIVTNSTMRPGSLFLHSLNTYLQYIPENNFMAIPGNTEGGKPNYGLSAFVQMINILTSETYKNAFDYVIYIDEDCFIKDFNSLLIEFERFKNSNYCIAGLPDGGVICHRNQSRILVNAFLSFWNIKAIRENSSSYANVFNILMYAQKPYKVFIEELKKKSELYNVIDQNSKDTLLDCARYRIKNFKHDPPHADVVRNDQSNNYEPNQVPYSFKGLPDQNMEPYYLVEEAMVISTGLPIYYLFGTDLYSNEEVDYDNSGLTTVIMERESKKHIAYHTWFARKYKPFNTNIQDIKKHVNRINSVINMTNKQ